MRNRKRLIWLLPLAVAAATVTYRFIEGRRPSDSPSIRVSGNIEATDVEVSFKIPGRVEMRPVSEGEMVKAGDLMARLDSQELAQDVALHRAEVQAAQAALNELLAGSRPEEIAEAEAAVRKAQAWLDELLAGSRSQDIAAHKATVERAKAEVDRLEAEYTRQTTLYKNDVISAREYEATQAALEAAKALFREDHERSARLPFNQVHAEDPVLRDGRAARLGLPEHDFDRRFAHFILRNVHGRQRRMNNA